MKKNHFLILIVPLVGISLGMLSMKQSKEKFYYGFDKKILLHEKGNSILVKYDKESSKDLIEKSIESNINFTILKKERRNNLISEITTSSLVERQELVKNLKERTGVLSCEPLYSLDDGLEIGVTNEILIQFLPTTSKTQIEELSKTLRTKLVKTTKVYQKLELSKNDDAVEIANLYYESGLVKFATPSFLTNPVLHEVIPNDTYFNMQITCRNTGQAFTDNHTGTVDADIDASDAWELTTGSNNITIAVLDQGVTSNHPDLPNTRQVRLNGSNFADGDSNDPSPTLNNNHGNACAGVIAATMNNNQGIAGIAPNCKIMPIRIFNSDGTGISEELLADAIEFAVDNGADILSNSWGYQTSEQNFSPVIISAINYAFSHDKVVVFSAGNTASHDIGNNGYGVAIFDWTVG
ncbi:S8 family serine peptidase [Mangrovibacterium sp.]|uniref:S8 family peptidase n=1 Tax=Mangrovibacterium sp. TaxID=1961364 RepID=UPI003568DC15